VARLAARQHGVVTGRQLGALGLDRRAISYRVRVGRLHPLHRAVFAVGHAEISTEGRFLAAALAIGDGAAVGYLPAAILQCFWRPTERLLREPVDVIVNRRLKPREGIRLHLVRFLDERDVTRVKGIPVTTPARTLLDLADELRSDRALRRAVNEALVQRRVNERQLREQLARSNGRRGARRLAAIVADGPTPTRSGLEDQMLDLLRRHNFPRPLSNADVPGLGLEVDIFFPDHGLVIEVDSNRYHGTKLAREADARKQATLEAAGHRVIRIDEVQLMLEDQTVARLRHAVASGPCRPPT
jgi:very-short-patch-repair endonuclease/predicted transcriptional regulator of viral defense system